MMCEYCGKELLEVAPNKYQCVDVCCPNHFVSFGDAICDICGSKMVGVICSAPYSCTNKDCKKHITFEIIK